MLAAALVLLLPASLFAGCGQAGAKPPQSLPNEGGAGEIRVVATIFPGYDFTREIAGEHICLTLLLPPGAESHSFEPTPQDIIAIQDCDIFIYVGGESDAWVDGILASMDTSGMTVLSMTGLVEMVEEEHKEGMAVSGGPALGGREHSHDEEAPAYDEHVWTSPPNAMRIVEAIAGALCTADAAHADVYRGNAAAYVGRLEELDACFREVVRNAKRKTLIFGDRFPFRYFVEEYGLDYYAAFPGCAAETEANARTIAFLIDKVREEHIPAVFHIELSNEKIADAICESTEAQKLLMHSCHSVTKSDFESGVSYLKLMEKNAENLKEALR